MTKTDCQFYNWNDNPDYPIYPREYGARCERFKIFFLIFLQRRRGVVKRCPGD